MPSGNPKDLNQAAELQSLLTAKSAAAQPSNDSKRNKKYWDDYEKQEWEIKWDNAKAIILQAANNANVLALLTVIRGQLTNLQQYDVKKLDSIVKAIAKEAEVIRNKQASMKSQDVFEYLARQCLGESNDKALSKALGKGFIFSDQSFNEVKDKIEEIRKIEKYKEKLVVKPEVPKAAKAPDEKTADADQKLSMQVITAAGSIGKDSSDEEVLGDHYDKTIHVLLKKYVGQSLFIPSKMQALINEVKRKFKCEENEAKYHIGIYFYNQDNYSNSWQLLVTWLVEAAESGHLGAMYQLAVLADHIQKNTQPNEILSRDTPSENIDPKWLHEGLTFCQSQLAGSLIKQMDSTYYGSQAERFKDTQKIIYKRVFQLYYKVFISDSKLVVNNIGIKEEAASILCRWPNRESSRYGCLFSQVGQYLICNIPNSIVLYDEATRWKNILLNKDLNHNDRILAAQKLNNIFEIKLDVLEKYLFFPKPRDIKFFFINYFNCIDLEQLLKPIVDDSGKLFDKNAVRAKTVIDHEDEVIHELIEKYEESVFIYEPAEMKVLVNEVKKKLNCEEKEAIYQIGIYFYNQINHGDLSGWHETELSNIWLLTAAKDGHLNAKQRLGIIAESYLEKESRLNCLSRNSSAQNNDSKWLVNGVMFAAKNCCFGRESDHKFEKLAAKKDGYKNYKICILKIMQFYLQAFSDYYDLIISQKEFLDDITSLVECTCNNTFNNLLKNKAVEYNKQLAIFNDANANKSDRIQALVMLEKFMEVAFNFFEKYTLQKEEAKITGKDSKFLARFIDSIQKSSSIDNLLPSTAAASPQVGAPDTKHVGTTVASAAHVDQKYGHTPVAEHDTKDLPVSSDPQDKIIHTIYKKYKKHENGFLPSKEKLHLTNNNWEDLWLIQFNKIKNDLITLSEGDPCAEVLLETITEQLTRISKKAKNNDESAIKKIVNTVSSLTEELCFISKNKIKGANIFQHLKKQILDSSQELYKSLGGGRIALTSHKSFQEIKDAIINVAEVLLYKSNQFLSYGEYDKTIIYSKAVLSLDVSNDLLVAAYEYMGMGLTQLGRDDEAIDAYDAALKINEYTETVRNQKSRLLGKLGRYTEKTILDDNPCGRSPMDIMDITDTFSKGIAYISYYNNFEKALTYFDSALYSEPLNDQIHCAKGFVLYHLQRYDEALKSYEIILKRNPYNRDAFYHKNLILAKLNKKQLKTTSQQLTEQKRVSVKPLVVEAPIKSDDKTSPNPKPAATFTQKLSELEQQQIQLKQLLDQQQDEDEKSMQGSYDQKDSKYSPAPVDAAGNIDRSATAAASVTVNTNGSDSKEIAPIAIEPIPADDPRLIPRAYNPTPELLKSQQEKLQAQVDVINMRLEWLRANIKSGDEKNRSELQKMEKEMRPILDAHAERQIFIDEQMLILSSKSVALIEFNRHLQAALNSYVIGAHANASGKVESSSTAGKIIAAVGSLLSPVTFGATGAGASIVNFFRSQSSGKAAKTLTTSPELYSINSAEQLVARIASKLTLRYRDPISKLSVAAKYSNAKSFLMKLFNDRDLGGAQLLAEYVSTRIIHAMHAGKKTVEELVRAVSESTEFHGFKGLWDADLDLENVNLGKVTVSEVLNGSGIRVLQQDHKFKYYANCKPDEYINKYAGKMSGRHAGRVGFREGTEKEVEELEFSEVLVKNDTIVMAINPVAPTSAITKAAPARTLDVVVEAVGASHDTLSAELEFQKKQLRFFKAEFLKTETRLKRLEENATASRTTAPASAAQVVVSGAAVKSPIFKAPTPAANRDLNPLSLAAQRQGVELQTRAMPSLPVAGVK